MNERIPLSFLLVQNKDEDPPVEPVVPFPAMYLEEPRICTAVLERTCVLASASDEYERITATHDKVYVDREMVEWRAKTADYEGKPFQPGQGMAGHRQPSKSPWRTRPESAGASAREASDERARKNQEQVAATDKRELEVQLAASRAEAVKSDAFYAPDIHVVDDDPTLPTERSEFEGSFEEAGDAEEDAGAIITLVRDVIDKRPVGMCAKCGRSGRLNDAGICQRHQQRKSRTSSAPPPGARAVMPSRTPPVGDGSEEWHGTAGGYKNHSCRCDPCRKAQAESQHEYRERERLRLAGIEPPATGSKPSPAVALDAPLLNAEAVTQTTPISPFTELLNDLRQLSAYAASLEQDNATLRTENDRLRDEQAGLYDELHTIVGGIKKATSRGGR